MKKLLLTLALSTATISLAGCTGLYQPYPVVSGGSDIQQSHHHYAHHNHRRYTPRSIAQGPVVHTSGNSGISQSHY